MLIINPNTQLLAEGQSKSIMYFHVDTEYKWPRPFPIIVIEMEANKTTTSESEPNERRARPWYARILDELACPTALLMVSEKFTRAYLWSD